MHSTAAQGAQCLSHAAQGYPLRSAPHKRATLTQSLQPHQTCCLHAENLAVTRSPPPVRIRRLPGSGHSARRLAGAGGGTLYVLAVMRLLSCCTWLACRQAKNSDSVSVLPALRSAVPNTASSCAHNKFLGEEISSLPAFRIAQPNPPLAACTTD